jgi:SPP1 family predicted phage head-tail adaptor
MPKAGDLDQQITIEVPDTTPDELGQNAEAWTDPVTVWAKVMETPGREFLSGDYQAEEKAVFVIRWRAVDSTARATWNGRPYRIESVTGTRREGWAYLHCVATDGAN